jgi:hypothetical protein
MSLIAFWSKEKAWCSMVGQLAKALYSNEKHSDFPYYPVTLEIVRKFYLLLLAIQY